MSRLDARLQALVARALAEALSGGLVGPWAGSAETGGWRAEIRLERVEPGNREPTSDCEKDILELLTDAPEPRSQAQVVADLEAAGRIHGESTIRHALASMRRRGLLVLGPGGRGYLVPI